MCASIYNYTVALSTTATTVPSTTTTDELSTTATSSFFVVVTGTGIFVFGVTYFLFLLLPPHYNLPGEEAASKSLPVPPVLSHMLVIAPLQLSTERDTTVPLA